VLVVKLLAGHTNQAGTYDLGAGAHARAGAAPAISRLRSTLALVAEMLDKSSNCGSTDSGLRQRLASGTLAARRPTVVAVAVAASLSAACHFLLLNLVGLVVLSCASGCKCDGRNAEAGLDLGVARPGARAFSATVVFVIAVTLLVSTVCASRHFSAERAQSRSSDNFPSAVILELTLTIASGG